MDLEAEAAMAVAGLRRPNWACDGGGAGLRRSSWARTTEELEAVVGEMARRMATGDSSDGKLVAEG